jgi:hypothetical protein
MANFNLADYETVDSRIHRFYEAFPNGRIITELVDVIRVDGKITQYVVKSYAYRDMSDAVPSATGYAEESVGSSPVNRTSALENCETSSIGRCLSNLGLSPKGSRPSQEEMQKAERSKQTKKPLSQVIEEVTPAVEKMAKIEELKKEAYAKAKFYRLEKAMADQFLMSFSKAKSHDTIDWYAISLESRESWQKAVDSWNSQK